MPVRINGGRGTATWSNEKSYRTEKSGRRSLIITPGDLDAFSNPSFEKDLSGWQGTAIGWDSTTLSRVFSVPILFDAVPTVGTNGSTPTSSEAAPDAIDSTSIDSTATLVYSTTAPILGTISYVATANGSQKAAIVKGGFSGFNRQFVRCYFNKSTAPAVNQSIIKGWQTTIAGTQGLSVRVNTSRKLEIINAANTVAATTTNSIPIGSVFHVLVDITFSTGAGTLYLWTSPDGDNPFYFEALPIAAGANAFGTQGNTWTFGNCATNNVTGTLKFGGIAISYVDPGIYEPGEVSGNAIAADSGKWVMKVVYPTGTLAAGTLYKIPGGTFPAGLKKMVKFRVYVPSGSPDVFVREYNTGVHGPPMTTKDSWQDVSLQITTTTGDQFVGVIDGTLPSASHTSGQYFLVDSQTNRDWPGIIANPNFVENLNGWSNHYFAWDDSTITRDTFSAGGYDDDWAVKVVYPTPSSGYSGLLFVTPAEENLVVGRIYRFDAMVWVPATNPDVVAELPFGAAGAVVTAKNAWTPISVTGVCTSATQVFGIRNAVLNSYTAGQYFLADNAQITDLGVSAPNSPNGFLMLI